MYNVLSMHCSNTYHIKSLFDSVVVFAFQITFCDKIHANDIFYFLKFIFDISTSK